MTTNGQRSELSDSTTLASFSARVAKGASALVGMRMIVRVLGFISMLILARLLTPEDYGIIALATLLHGLLIAMSDFGFGLAIIRDSEAKDVDYHTAWTLRVLRSAVVALIVIVSAVPFADFYEDSRLQSVMYCYAAMAMVMGLENIGTVNFIKEMRYRDDFNYFFISKLVSFIVGITAAFILRNYWALVIGSFCLSLSRLGLSYYLDSFRPRFSLASWRKLLHFTKWTLADHTTLYLASRIEFFVFGKILSVATLGLYTFAVEFAAVVTSEIAQPISRAVYPALSKLQSNADEVRTLFRRSMGLTILVVAPLGVGLGLVAEPAVAFLLGEKWSGIAPILTIIVLYGIVRTFFELMAPPFYILERPDLPLKLNVLNLILRLATLIVALQFLTFIGTLWALTAAGVVQLAIVAYTFDRFGVLSFGDFLGCIWRPAMGCACMALMLNGLYPFALSQPGLQLVSMVATGAVIYASTIAGLYWFFARDTDCAELGVLRLLQRLKWPAMRVRPD